MSKLEELIAELCSDGVEYKMLKDISVMQRGTSVTKKNIISGNVPVISGGKEPAYYCNKYNRDGETITVAGSGAGAGYVQYWDTPIFVCDAFSIKAYEKFSTKYLFYCLANMQDYIYSTKKGSGVPHVHISSIDSVKVPVPPLPVQSEIVRILDNFTEFTEELTVHLTAELTVRKKQYEYYRKVLLTFSDNAPKMRLGDNCDMKAGKAIKSELISVVKTDNTNYECFGGNGVRGYVSEPNQHGDFPIIGRQGALCGNVNYATGDFYATEHAVVVKSKGAYTHRFLFYLLKDMNLNQYKSQGAQPGLAVKNIEELLAWVPSIARQNQVVELLDRFDTLCNDITTGLSAEIEARKKQYEYYRDKILNLKRLEG